MYIYLYYIMRGHVTNKKWYNSTYSKLIITKQDRCVTCSVKRPLKGEWSLSQVFFWGQVINETLYILTFTTKHERLMLKIGTNWCSKFIKRYEIYKKLARNNFQSLCRIHFMHILNRMYVWKNILHLITLRTFNNYYHELCDEWLWFCNVFWFLDFFFVFNFWLKRIDQLSSAAEISK